MRELLSTEELIRLLEGVFAPRREDRSLAVLVDLPDERVPDTPAWTERREIAQQWTRQLDTARGTLGLETVSLVRYRNVRRNNADLPERAELIEGAALATGVVAAKPLPFSQVFSSHRLLIAMTEFSATAPLKLAAPQYGFRGVTMPGFGPAMIPALRLDYDEIGRRCEALKSLLDPVAGARIIFLVDGEPHELELDLRYRSATVSGGLVREPGKAGNLPSGETYIVPYEGERAAEPSRSRGLLPVQFADEVVVYRIEQNRAVGVRGKGPRADHERRELAAEPAYGNLAELGLGVLGDYGLAPIGEILLDEKLGLHIAFGRSDHFGGQIGADDFSSPDKVVHIDRVYVPEMQPRIAAKAVDLLAEDGSAAPLMREGRYVTALA
ncbi:MAG: hypothetical protein JSV80_17255 [Acidobacteriota bacterium]|nr:MAG: hypothetical protein JSV80_17255 [Acidobacteriota bacterium]